MTSIIGRGQNPQEVIDKKGRRRPDVFISPDLANPSALVTGKVSDQMSAQSAQFKQSFGQDRNRNISFLNLKSINWWYVAIGAGILYYAYSSQNR